jgi:hypothetical protein
MASPAAGRDEFTVLDQQILRSLVTLRTARDACRAAATPQNLALRDRAEEHLNALLDFRSGARRRRVQGDVASGWGTVDRLPA